MKRHEFIKPGRCSSKARRRRGPIHALTREDEDRDGGSLYDEKGAL